MGGKALKVETVRKNTNELYRIYNEISPIIVKELGVDTHLVKFYHKKETHGDLDILLRVDRQLPNLVDFVESTFKPNDIHNNGGVVSFDYDNFQVDLIPIRVSNWEVAKCFFSYDPKGNLMGKIAHSFGFKYGFEGLIYPMRNFNGRISKDIVLSKDNHKIFDFLGLDYSVYEKGFDTMEEIFNFIINGKYFNSKKYDMENLTSIDRKRNRKRKSYQDFLKYLSDNNINKSFDFQPKEYYLEVANSYFPESNLLDQIEKFRKIDNENKNMSEKFNGNLIMEVIPELKGKELGHAMNEFKSNFDDFRSYLLENSSEDILNYFKNWYLKK